jgi:hypothetical protein
LQAAAEEEKLKRHLTERSCFEEAIALAGDNPSVLSRAGKFFR